MRRRCLSGMLLAIVMLTTACGENPEDSDTSAAPLATTATGAGAVEPPSAPAPADVYSQFTTTFQTTSREGFVVSGAFKYSLTRWGILREKLPHVLSSCNDVDDADAVIPVRLTWRNDSDSFAVPRFSFMFGGLSRGAGTAEVHFSSGPRCSYHFGTDGTVSWSDVPPGGTGTLDFYIKLDDSFSPLHPEGKPDIFDVGCDCHLRLTGGSETKFSGHGVDPSTHPYPWNFAG